MEVHIYTSEVKFLDCVKMNLSEGILQGRACQSRTKVGGSKTIRYRRSLYSKRCRLRIGYRFKKTFVSFDDFSSALQEIKSFWVPGGV